MNDPAVAAVAAVVVLQAEAVAERFRAEPTDACPRELPERRHDSGIPVPPGVSVDRVPVLLDAGRSCQKDGRVAPLASAAEGGDRVALYRVQSAASSSAARTAVRPFVSEEPEAQQDQCEPEAE